MFGVLFSLTSEQAEKAIMEPYVVGLALVVIPPRPRAQFDAHAHRSVQLPQFFKHVFPDIVTPSNVVEYVAAASSV